MFGLKFLKRFDLILLRGLSANALGQILTIAIQLFSLPIYLSVWSIEQYGVWLMIAAIPVYFSLADTGISAVAMNKMTMLIAQKRPHEANIIFQTALIFITAIVICLMVVVGFSVYISKILFSFDHSLTLMALIAATLINIYSGLIDGLFRSTNKYATGTNFLTLARLIEWIFSLVGLLLFRTPIGCALGYLIGRSLSFLSLVAISICYVPEYAWGFSLFSKTECKSLFFHSKRYVLLPISFALTLQGTTLVVGLFLGPSAVVIFATYRTISRSITQFVGAIAHSLWPQFTQLYALGEKKILSVKIAKWSHRSAVISITMSIITLLFSNQILEYWTHGRVALDISLLALLLFTSSISAATNIFYIFSISTNNYGRLPFAYISVAFISLIIVATGARFGGVLGVALASIFIESVLYFFARSNANYIVREMRKLSV